MGVLSRCLLVAWPAGSGGLASAQTAERQAESLDAEQVYEISQDAIGRMVGGHVLRDQNGEELPLAALRWRPLVVSLIYTSCSSVCPVTTEHLRESVVDARKALGNNSFAVLTFGFDASGDRPAQLRAFAGSHRLRGLGDWYLASADAATTEALLSDLGFSWRAAAGSFDHPTQTTVLDAEGRVYRQIYGEAFPLPTFMEPLKNLILGRQTRSLAPDDLWDRLTFLCTVYNPLTR